ncbi:MAG: DUF1211 domain-containing protein [Proteobacteria bacterium]|nr:DUF1211 domain-containing protein [Pseudomonadota bacterium]
MPAPLEIHLPRSRLDALADGVYAIAVTLLVLELRLPPLGAGVSQAALKPRRPRARDGRG